MLGWSLTSNWPVLKIRSKAFFAPSLCPSETEHQVYKGTRQSTNWITPPFILFLLFIFTELANREVRFSGWFQEPQLERVYVIPVVPSRWQHVTKFVMQIILLSQYRNYEKLLIFVYLFALHK